MSLETDIFSIAQFAGLSALIGARLYPDVAPVVVAKPYCVWQQVSAAPVNGLGGYHGNTQYRVQITTWALDATKAREVDLQVRAAMAAASFKSLHVDNRALPYEADTKLHGVQSDFSIWVAE